MIKRILIALDPDDDTPVATQYAIELAKKFDASVTGLAVVDTSNIYPTGIIGEPDMTHHARNLWEELSDESREVAKRLLDRFQKTVEKTGIRYTAIKQEGASYDRIIEGMKYHDLLVVGRESHFFYNEPRRETKTLAQVVKHGVSPTLVVMDRYKDVQKVLVAFDGSNPSARSLKSFVHLMPYGKELEIELFYVEDEVSERTEENGSSILDYAEHYLKEHQFTNTRKTIVSHKKPSEKIMERRDETDADLIVLGAHAVSALKRITFGSNTHDLITQSDTPLFLSP